MFKKETNNNVLTDAHIKQIMQAFGSKEDIEHFAKSVSFESIAENNYNLSVSSYVEAKDNREVIDITKLNMELKPQLLKSTGFVLILMSWWLKLRAWRLRDE